jgi:hypothetical protein
MSLKRTAAAIETSETARSVQKLPDDADDVSGGRLEAKFANAVADDTLAGNTVPDDASRAEEEAVQKILQRKVRKVAVRKPGGQEGCVELNNGHPLKLPVGYHMRFASSSPAPTPTSRTAPSISTCAGSRRTRRFRLPSRACGGGAKATANTTGASIAPRCVGRWWVI